MDPNAGYLKDSEQFLEDINNELFEDDLELVEGVEDPVYSIIFIETGGSEMHFIKDVDKLTKPVILMSNCKNNSLPACFEIKTYLENKDIECVLLFGEESNIANSIKHLSKIMQAKYNVEHAVLGVIGKPSDWLIASQVDYEEVKKKFGVTLIDIDSSELKEEMSKGVLTSIPRLKELRNSDIDKNTLDGALTIYSGLKRIIKKHKLNGFTLRCFDLIEDYKNTACLAFAILNEEGYLAACEGDVPSLLSMLFIKEATNQPSFQANPSKIDLKESNIILAHCTVPFNMLNKYERECNRLFGLTAERTLACTQSLYEKKLVTYPRTDSRYLTEDMGQTAIGVIGKIHDEMPFAQEGNYSLDVRKVIDNRKVTDHHAIIPTVEINGDTFSELSKDEKKVFVMIAGRLMAATMGDYIYVVNESTILCEGYSFKSKARTVTQEGFKSVDMAIRKYFGLKQEETKEPERMPDMEYESVETVVSEQFTQPPKQYTEDTLLSAMQRAGNEELTEETEKQGIGTPATRAAIIEKIIKCGFAQRDKKNLIPTKDGIALITILPEELVSPKMTADWEMELTRIAKGKGNGEDFIRRIEGMVSDLVKRYSSVSAETQVFSGSGRKSMGNCPNVAIPCIREGRTTTARTGSAIFPSGRTTVFLRASGLRLTRKRSVTSCTTGSTDTAI